MRQCGGDGRGRDGMRIFAAAAALLSAALLAAAAWAPAAQAQPEPMETTLSLSNQLEGWYQTDLRETVLDNRLDARVSHGPYALGVTLLSHSPSDPVLLDPNDFGPQLQEIRKRWVEATTDRFQLRAGDVYTTFGRGLALAVFEDQTIDFDNVLDGVNARVTTGPAELEIIGGTNSLGASALVLKGGRAGLALPGRWRTGVHGVWADFNAAGGTERERGERLYGGLLQGPLGDRADLYGEYVVRDQRDGDGAKSLEPDGHAGYVSANLYLGRLQLLGEYKDLWRYDLGGVLDPGNNRRSFINPPTALRQHASTLLNRGGHTPNINAADERGGIAEAYLTVTEKTRLTGSYSRSRGRETPFSAWEIYGDVEQWLGEVEVILRAAETEETFQEGIDAEGPVPLFVERRTIGGTAVLPLGGTWSLDVSADFQAAQESNRRTHAFVAPVEYNGQFVTATIATSRGIAWSVNAEFTNDEYPAVAGREEGSWFWGEMSMRLGDRHQLLLGGGETRKGQVCSGGVCKLVDAFEGGRLELLTTF